MIGFKAYLNEKVDLPAKSKTLGINRKDMPQIDHEHMNDFLSYLKANDVSYSKESVDPDTLKATQNQFHIAKIQAIMDKIESGDYKKKRIVVSENDYVIDGHHTWIAHKNLDKKIDVIRIEAKAKNIVSLMHDFPKSYTKKLHEDFDVMLLGEDICPNSHKSTT